MVLTRKSVYDTTQSACIRFTQHGFELLQHLYVFRFLIPCIVVEAYLANCNQRRRKSLGAPYLQLTDWYTISPVIRYPPYLHMKASQTQTQNVYFREFTCEVLDQKK